MSVLSLTSSVTDLIRLLTPCFLAMVVLGVSVVWVVSFARKCSFWESGGEVSSGENAFSSLLLILTCDRGECFSIFGKAYFRKRQTICLWRARTSSGVFGDAGQVFSGEQVFWLISRASAGKLSGWEVSSFRFFADVLKLISISPSALRFSFLLSRLFLWFIKFCHLLLAFFSVSAIISLLMSFKWPVRCRLSKDMSKHVRMCSLNLQFYVSPPSAVCPLSHLRRADLNIVIFLLNQLFESFFKGTSEVMTSGHQTGGTIRFHVCNVQFYIVSHHMSQKTSCKENTLKVSSL